MRNRTRNTGGFVLIFVLGFLLVMVFTALQFHRTSTASVERMRAALDAVRARYLADVGGEIAVRMLAEDTNSYDWLGEPWIGTKTYTVGGFRLDLLVEDEDAKINLNGILGPEGKVNSDLLEATRNLFVLLGASQNCVDSLLDWMDEDELPRVFGAEESYYRGRVPACTPPNRPLASLDELYLIKDFTPELLKGHPDQGRPGLLDFVTLHSDSKINVNTCEPLLLQALGFNEVDSMRIVDARRSGPLEERGLLSINRNAYLARRSVIKFRSNFFSVASEAGGSGCPRRILRAYLKRDKRVEFLERFYP